ncbi:amidohydrolase family protein [Aliifodinibius sp. S!AR15-10]|uniref:amidohydrolase family protein n=1 Tax=Aliifodinibius sp. S!AR15-10 TaxID=2950437 RepID=UPI002857F39B|nr:amidohydrolase family protein [Aliifodinibius sp. S!AR15-10]MDR8392129.1 amidohydrolase family protein [Aliifodinibius sp. S!AR15-10]
MKDYRPESLYKAAGSEVDKARYPVIDMHSHNQYAESPEEIREWIQTMDEVGIEKAILLTKATGAQFDSLHAVFSQWEDRFELWCGIDYTGYETDENFTENAIEELERLHDMGAGGIGELGDKGEGLFYSTPTQAFGMHIDDPRMSPILDKAGQLNMPIHVHMAEPIWMYQEMDSTNDGLMNAYEWRLDNKAGIKSHDQMMQILENAVRDHPNTTFIAAHMANSAYDLSNLDRMLDTYPNLYSEIGARYSELSQTPRHVAAFINKHQDRIFYGTDMGRSPEMYKTTFKILETEDEHFYRHDLFGYHWSLNGFGLEDNVLQKVYRNNALKLLNQ